MYHNKLESFSLQVITTQYKLEWLLQYLQARLELAGPLQDPSLRKLLAMPPNIGIWRN
jgi:hypothetical protein